MGYEAGNMNDELFDLMQEYLDKIKKTSVPVKTMGGTLEFNPFYSMIHVSLVREGGFEVVNGGTRTVDLPKQHEVSGRLTVRMGDYDKSSAAHIKFFLPYTLKKDVGKITLRLAANEAIWNSIDNYISRLESGLGTNKVEDSFLKFSRETPVRHIEKKGMPKRSVRELQRNLEEVTRVLIKGPVISCGANLRFLENQRYLTSTEGTIIYTRDSLWSTWLTVRTIDSENRVLEHSHSFKGKADQSFPSLERLLEEGEKLVSEISEMTTAKIEKNGAYPTIMDYNNHGVIWHEVVGHSLEGHRMQDGEWGDAANLFAERMGEKVAPKFINLYDDPTRQGLNAHYLYDEEGVPGQKVALIENGVLKNFLHSRESAGYMKTQSNGHARAEDSEVPVSRMSNLIVQSSNEMSYEELKDRLISECKRQKKPYGLIMREAEGGLTLPDDSMFMTYPTNVFRLYTDGRIERVRGVYIVGTPAQALENMLATSDRYATFDGFCGAESGTISSTITAPDLLLKCVEVNRIPNSSYDTFRNNVLPE
jgi:TldD protein